MKGKYQNLSNSLDWYTTQDKNHASNYYNAIEFKELNSKFIAPISQSEGYIIDENDLFKFEIKNGNLLLKEKLSSRDYSNVYHFEIRAHHLFILFSPSSQDFESHFSTLRVNSNKNFDEMEKNLQQSKLNKNLYLDIFHKYQRVSSDISLTGVQCIKYRKNSAHFISDFDIEEEKSKGFIDDLNPKPLKELCSYNENSLFFEVLQPNGEDSPISYLAINRMRDNEVVFYELNGMGSIYLNRLNLDDIKENEIKEKEEKERGTQKIQKIKKSPIPKRISHRLYTKVKISKENNVTFINNFKQKKFCLFRSDGMIAFLELKGNPGFQKFDITSVKKIDLEELQISNIFSTCFLDNFFYISCERIKNGQKREYGMINFFVNGFNEFLLNEDTLLKSSNKCK